MTDNRRDGYGAPLGVVSYSPTSNAVALVEPKPCPFCGGPAKTFRWDGATQAGCAGDFKDCAGSDVMAPVAMWNTRDQSQAARIAELEEGEALLGAAFDDLETALRPGTMGSAWRLDPSYSILNLSTAQDYRRHRARSLLSEEVLGDYGLKKPSVPTEQDDRPANQQEGGA